MVAVKHIDFGDLDSIKSRDAVRFLFKDADQVKSIHVDFSKVEFISRTAAHELLTVQDRLSSEGVDVSFLNVCSQVNEMLQLVTGSLNREKRQDFRFVKWLTFENDKKYQEYLHQF